MAVFLFTLSALIILSKIKLNFSCLYYILLSKIIEIKLKKNIEK